MAMTISSYQKNCRREAAPAGREKGSRHSYLTVVNDVVEKGGTSSLKDMAVLQRLFQTEESLQNHASDVLRLAKEGGYDGVEIDYEGLWKRGDSLLQSQYVHFLHVLVRMAEKEAIPVRVVLEPSVPFDAGFPPRGLVCCHAL